MIYGFILIYYSFPAYQIVSNVHISEADFRKFNKYNLFQTIKNVRRYVLIVMGFKTDKE